MNFNRSTCLRFLFFFFSLFTIEQYSSGQVVINEIQTSNIYGFHDEFNKNCDWIELYNSGNSSVNLNGYGLTDNLSKPFLFRFPDYNLAAGGYVLVLGSDSNKTIVKTHWETAVKANDTWKYRANTTSPGSINWRDLNFNDASWSSGTGGIGFGDNDDGTTVSTCISVYMRKTFNIPDTSKIVEGVLNMDFDDGFVAYLNGVEIARVNIGVQGSIPEWNDAAPAAFEGLLYQNKYPDSVHLDLSLLRSLLKNGTNVLAVETHNQASNNTDLSSNPYLTFSVVDGSSFFGSIPSWFHRETQQYFHAAFKMKPTGETIYLSNPSGNIIDQKLTGIIEADNSLARNPDGSNSWCFMQTSTPGASNNASGCAAGYATPPVFSAAPGFYSGTKTLSMSTSFPGGTIRYTTNGADVTSSSSLYSSPITISSTKTIKARVFAANALTSSTTTSTYFINLDCRLPVYCLTTDPANLNDYNTGIFVDGPDAQSGNPHWGANYWKGFEKPVTVEYFDRDKSLAFQFTSALEVTGGWSRADPQKSLEIKFGEKYGYSNINYSLVDVKPWIDKWDNFVFSAMGQDKAKCRMRDPLMNRIMKNTNCDFIGSEPCLLRINGENWGVYYLRENDDHHWINHNYGYKADEIDLLKESYFYPGIEIKKGTDSAFFAMYNYAVSTSPSDPSFYSVINSMMDLDNMADYFIAETYYPNNDWMGGTNNNLKLWRPHKPGGKFRYLLYDLDFGLGLSGSATDNVLSTALNASPHNFNSELLSRFTQNAAFKRYFINRYADLINTIYLPSNVQDEAYRLRDSLRHDMHFQNEKWGGPDTTAWKTNIASMLSFSSQRPANVRNQIKSSFGLAGQVTLTLQVSPAGAGRIEISTISPTSYPWNGVYFNGNPVTITAIPNPGYSFDHWRSNNTITSNNTSQAVTYNFTASDVITCYFTGSSVTPDIAFSEINYNGDSISDPGDWIELHNAGSTAIDISNWKFRDAADNHTFTLPVGTSIAANGYLVLASNLVKFQSVFPTINNVIGSFNFDFSNLSEELRLFDYNGSLYTSVTYADYQPWPLQADGGGYTLERLNMQISANDPNNWFAGCYLGSPGRAYSTSAITVTVQNNNGPHCAGTNVLLSASAQGSTSFQWKKNNIDISGAVQHTYTAAQNGVYSVLVNANGCSSISDTVVVSFIPVEHVTSTTDADRCQSGSVILSAAGTSALNWFDVPSGGNVLYTGNNFTTPTLTQPATYYVEASGPCIAARLPVHANIIAPTAPPVTYDAARCGAGHVNLNASGTDTIYWYDAITGGNLLDSGTVFHTPTIQQTTIYYAQTGNTCPGGRTGASAVINTITPDPSGTGASRCGSGMLTLTASSPSVDWYETANGNLLNSGNQFVTPVLNQTTTYYIREGTLCPSGFVPIAAIINQVTPDPVTNDVSRCDAGSITLSAVSSDSIFWYDAPGGSLLGSGNSLSIPNVTSTTLYFAQAGNLCPSNFIPVYAIINPLPEINLGNDTIINSGNPIVLDAGSGFISYIWNTQEITETISVYTSGFYYVTVTDANGCQGSDGIDVTISTSTNELLGENSISIYPNPSNGKFHLMLPAGTSHWDIKFTDAAGKLLMEKEVNQFAREIEIEAYTTGVYFLSLKNAEISKVVKLFVR